MSTENVVIEENGLQTVGIASTDVSYCNNEQYKRAKKRVVKH